MAIDNTLSRVKKLR